jgi:acyl transferase domain-containing protein
LILGQARKSPKLAWLFTDAGSEYVGMGETLYRTQPVFRAAVDRYDEQLWQDREGSLAEVMFRDDSLLSQTLWKQPALFVLQAALVELWQSWGVQPDVVLGSGLGQYAAACVAGVMTWEDGLRLVAERSRLIGAVSGQAATTAARVGEGHVGADANSHADVSIVSSAALDEFERFADTIDYFPADRPLICNLSGEVVPVHKLLGGSYWRRHLSEPPQLTKSIQTLAGQDCQLTLEVGPHPSLSQFAASCWPAPAPPLMASLCNSENETACIFSALGQMYVHGIMPDFATFDQPWPRKKIALPTYPFERSRYWITDVCKYAGEK